MIQIIAVLLGVTVPIQVPLSISDHYDYLVCFRLQLFSTGVARKNEILAITQLNYINKYEIKFHTVQTLIIDYSSPDTVRIVKLQRLCWTEHVA